MQEDYIKVFTQIRRIALFGIKTYGLIKCHLTQVEN